MHARKPTPSPSPEVCNVPDGWSSPRDCPGIAMIEPNERHLIDPGVLSPNSKCGGHTSLTSVRFGVSHSYQEIGLVVADVRPGH